jgi:hypothetical protein
MFPLVGSLSTTGDKLSGSKAMAAATAFKSPYLLVPNVIPPLLNDPLLKAWDTRCTKPGEGFDIP